MRIAGILWRSKNRVYAKRGSSSVRDEPQRAVIEIFAA
jgi:hypothetical protein